MLRMFIEIIDMSLLCTSKWSLQFSGSSNKYERQTLTWSMSVVISLKSDIMYNIYNNDLTRTLVLDSQFFYLHLVRICMNQLNCKLGLCMIYVCVCGCEWECVCVVYVYLIVIERE